MLTTSKFHDMRKRKVCDVTVVWPKRSNYYYWLKNVKNIVLRAIYTVRYLRYVFCCTHDDQKREIIFTYI